MSARCPPPSLTTTTTFLCLLAINFTGCIPCKSTAVTQGNTGAAMGRGQLRWHQMYPPALRQQQLPQTTDTHWSRHEGESAEAGTECVSFVVSSAPPAPPQLTNYEMGLILSIHTSQCPHSYRKHTELSVRHASDERGGTLWVYRCCHGRKLSFKTVFFFLGGMLLVSASEEGSNEVQNILLLFVG